MAKEIEKKEQKILPAGMPATKVEYQAVLEKFKLAHPDKYEANKAELESKLDLY